MEVMFHHAHTPPSRPSTGSELTIPTTLEDLVMECLEKDPARRPVSAVFGYARGAGLASLRARTAQRAQHTMNVAISQDPIGAEIREVDLAQPLSADTFGRIERAFNDHGVVCFPQQQLDEEQLIAFARRLGEVERIFLTHYAHPQYPEIMYVSNIKENGRDIGHSDAGRSEFRRTR